MESISVFDIFKIGVGPSSSHTMGPWRAAQRVLNQLRHDGQFEDIESLTVDLYGSLAKTGKGHGTDIAILLGLSGDDPATCDTGKIAQKVAHINAVGEIDLLGIKRIAFIPALHIQFRLQETLPFHPNGLSFNFRLLNGQERHETYYSIGGGFVIQENQSTSSDFKNLPYPIEQAADLLAHCQTAALPISGIVWQNELIWREPDTIRANLQTIWQTMLGCVYRGCHAEGELPGGLKVNRRAKRLHDRLLDGALYNGMDEWVQAIRNSRGTFQDILKWISCFALAVNEENAAFGRVVTAPTNGAAGVIPSVLMYYACFCPNFTDEDINRFLLVAGEIGSIFKKRATISAALGGCQAEIGVSSAMAAAALTECLGGTVEQSLMAAEIAMEHHLGLTCDPIRGLVQIPCIERNSMGAVKAITAANMALESDPKHAKVSLDAVIKTMWDTAQDMNIKYKETSEGGLAVNISVNVAEC